MAMRGEIEVEKQKPTYLNDQGMLAGHTEIFHVFQIGPMES